jgi:hypothetical protein
VSRGQYGEKWKSAKISFDLSKPKGLKELIDEAKMSIPIVDAPGDISSASWKVFANDVDFGILIGSFAKLRALIYP